MKKIIRILTCMCVMMSLLVTTKADQAQPNYCINCETQGSYYMLSGACDNMYFPNVPQTTAEVGWYLKVTTHYSNGVFTTPSFSIGQQDAYVMTNLTHDDSKVYLVLENCTYSISGNRMYITAYYHVRAFILNGWYNTSTYAETFTLVA